MSSNEDKVLALLIEGYQRYIEYLDALLDKPSLVDEQCLIVSLDGQIVRFGNLEKLSNWLAEEMNK